MSYQDRLGGQPDLIPEPVAGQVAIAVAHPWLARRIQTTGPALGEIVGERGSAVHAPTPPGHVRRQRAVGVLTARDVRIGGAELVGGKQQARTGRRAEEHVEAEQQVRRGLKRRERLFFGYGLTRNRSPLG